MLGEVNILEAVRERDVDLLLLEELTVSGPFRQWFMRDVVRNVPASFEILGAYHSFCGPSGETDLLVLFQLPEGKRLALLIENKIDAGFQPCQAERYQHRGEAGVNEGRWDEFKSGIVAPEEFLQAQGCEADFDFACSYERLKEWFEHQAESPERGHYKATLLRHAIEKSRRGYVASPDARVSAFWLAYWKVASEEFPQLAMPCPGPKPIDSDWPVFKPASLPKKVRIVHKCEKGCMDLELKGIALMAEEIRARVLAILPANVTIETTGKSLVFRSQVPILLRLEPFVGQQANAIVGLQAAVELLAMFAKFRSLMADLERESSLRA